MRHDAPHRGVSHDVRTLVEVDGVSRGPEPDEEMLVLDADAPPTAAVRASHQAAPGRRRGSSRGVGIAVATLVILTAGVVAGGFMDPPRPDGTSDPAVGPCVPAGVDEVPAFKVGIDGSDVQVAGAIGYASLPRGNEGSKSWRVPSPGVGEQVPELTPQDVLELRVDGNRCVRYVVAERAPAELAQPSSRDRRPLVDASVRPSSDAPALGKVPNGDWVIQVTAYFETGIEGDGGLVIGQRYFRIRVGDGPFPTVSPATPRPTTGPEFTPAVACGPTPAAADQVRVDLIAPGQDGVPGVAEAVDLPHVNVHLGEQLEMVIRGDACALSWTITVFDAETGDLVSRESEVNADDLPSTASQNRWLFDIPVGDHDVVAALHFGPELDVVRLWRVTGEGFDRPALILTAEDGSSVTAVGEDCLAVNLANGYSAGGDCGPIDIPESIPTLRVDAWSVVRVDVPGWTLSSWNGQCGRVVPDGGGGNYFEWECSLGGFYLEPGQEAPGPAEFLARPGDRLIQITIQADSDVGSYNVQQYLRVAGE